MFLDDKHQGPAPAVAAPLTEGLRVDRILLLADAIECPIPGRGFSMRDWAVDTSDCGTACCIGGHTNLLFGGPRHGGFAIAGDLLGLGKNQTWALFLPQGWDTDRSLNDRARAARVLRHLAATGIVDWEVPASPRA